MKKRSFVLPNLVATVRFVEDEKDVKLVLYSPDEATLKARLKRRYKERIEIKSIGPYDFAAGWGKVAQGKKKAVKLARAKGQKFDFSKNSIWGELKVYLFDVFDQHCAYCECDLLSDSFGGVEHYRPKNPVLDEVGHPGYHWLAYEPTNYLPTCSRCNTTKSNFFPLAPHSLRASAPGKEAAEQPLLLNPFFLGGEVADHLEFTFEVDPDKLGGVAKGRTPEGQASIERLGLNREDLVPKRAYEQNRAVGDYFHQRAAGMSPPPALEQVKAGLRPFSAATLDAFRRLAKP
jgi:hypothetical protein